ncbi:MAG TPA: phosphate-starvation-inducible PsiE family protein [Candidatus Nanoarchaeia archaeon]|nr:phosphate-starvation-inducible PsiE family protein [Candidatus Nanoarchaeia archaeon]
MDLKHFTNKNILKSFRGVFNLLVILLIMGLLLIILRELYSLFENIFSAEISVIINAILFIFILIELFTILTSYLRFGTIKVERVVEVGIISIVRDSIFHVFELDAPKMYGISALLLVFGLIFFVEKKFSKNRENMQKDN